MEKTTILCAESTLTSRYQTTIPEAVRKVLGLKKHDKISYTIQSDGQVIISSLDHKKDDPIVGEFLKFLAQDIQKNPHHLKTINSDLVNHLQSLVSGVDIDIDTPLLDEDD